MSHVSASAVCNGLTLMLSRYDDDHYVTFTRAVRHLLCTQPWICPLHGLCAFGDDQWSDAGLVAVEGRDVKHVAVCANPDGFHLTISGQRSRMGGAARAKDLK